MDGMVCRVGQEIQYSEQLIKAFEPKVFELKHPVLFVKYLALAGRAAVYADTAFLLQILLVTFYHKLSSATIAQLTSTICCDAQQTQF